MKRLLRSLLLAAVLTAALCVGALAAEPTVAGIYAVTGGDGVTLKPQTANQNVIVAKPQGGYNDYYVDAVRFDVEKTGLTEGAQYLLLVVKGTGAPNEENIVYIDQKAAGSDGKVSFNAYPSSLTKDNYRVYVVGDGSPFNTASPTASFSYYQPYKLGDADGNNSISVNDALFVLQAVAHSRTLEGTAKLAADADKNGNISVNDALFILQAVAHTRTLE